jgi:transposase
VNPVGGADHPNGRSATQPSERARERAKTGRPHSQELRSSVVAAIEAGASYREAAARFGVSGSAAVKWVHRFRQTGSIAAKPMGGDRRSRLKGERNWLLQRIAAEPGVTPAELHKELCARGIQVGYLTVRRFVKKEKIKLPKKGVRQVIRKPAHAKFGPLVTSTTRDKQSVATAPRSKRLTIRELPDAQAPGTDQIESNGSIS